MLGSEDGRCHPLPSDPRRSALTVILIGPEVRARVSDVIATELVEGIVEKGRREVPECAGLGPSLVPWIARRLDGEEHPDRLDPVELFLAAGCAAGERTALAAFERRYFTSIPAALRRLSLQGDDVAEVVQRLRVRLFVIEGGAPPRVLRYAGDGQLGGLVRVSSIRLGLNLLRSRGRLDQDADGLEELPIADDDPALAQLKQQSRASFKAAFEDAIAGLEPRERSLLNLALVKGLGIDKVAVVYGVHRATAARWIAQARGNLTRSVHAILGTRLGLPSAQVDDLLPLVESKLELSLERLLKTRVEP
jgi:RNA polymerase sigma-70 factor, ECF subfamily